jgi:hypothetical protein
MKCLVCSRPVKRKCFEINFGLLKGENDFKNSTNIGYVCLQCIPAGAQKFFVNEKREGSTIHLGTCSHCNYGWSDKWIPPKLGRAGSAWKGPYNTYEEAVNKAKDDTPNDHNCCKK